MITGASGALGSAVLDNLMQQPQYELFATTSKSSTQCRSHHVIEECDLRHPSQVSKALDIIKPDIILHLAASFSHTLSDNYLLNVAATQTLIDMCVVKKIPARIVMIGSAAEYGLVQPTDNPISELYRLNPISSYGVSKAWQSQLLGLYARQGVDIVCARIFNLYGPGISDRLFAGTIQNQIAAVKAGLQTKIKVGSLSATRDYLSTKAAAEQLLSIANYGNSGEIYHIGSGTPVVMRDFLYSQLSSNHLDPALVEETDSAIKDARYDVPVIYADMEKTFKLRQME